jgi:hypothetical protein
MVLKTKLQKTTPQGVGRGPQFQEGSKQEMNAD